MLCNNRKESYYQNYNTISFNTVKAAISLIKEDIKNGICHLVCEAGIIHGVFALCEGKDPTYRYIENGNWLSDDTYVTIHRIAGDQQAHGILKTAVEHCKTYADSIRADTHHDNAVMQGALKKLGFERCGVIYLKNGEPRVAFQWCNYERRSSDEQYCFTKAL